MPNNIVNNNDMEICLFLIKADKICPAMIPPKESIMTMIPLVGSFLNTSIPISSIFCQRAVDTAHNIEIGIRSQKYL